jgi:hypothetical protein
MRKRCRRKPCEYPPTKFGGVSSRCKNCSFHNPNPPLPPEYTLHPSLLKVRPRRFRVVTDERHIIRVYDSYEDQLLGMFNTSGDALKKADELELERAAESQAIFEEEQKTPIEA